MKKRIRKPIKDDLGQFQAKMREERSFKILISDFTISVSLN